MWVIDGMKNINNTTYSYHCKWGTLGGYEGWCDGNPYTYTGSNPNQFSKDLKHIYITK